MVAVLILERVVSLNWEFDDINADGLPEWVVLFGGETFGGPGMGYVNTGILYILSWRNNQLVDLSRKYDDERDRHYQTITFEEDAGFCRSPIPRDITWEFSNVDDDAALEILQYQMFRDNWYCESRRTEIYDWDEEADRYIFLNETYDFPNNTRNCALRFAEEAMWSEDFDTAIQEYERAFTLEPYQRVFTDDYSEETIEKETSQLQRNLGKL